MPKKIPCDDPSLIKLQMRAADLRLARVNAEKELIETLGKELSEGEKAAIEKRRREILYQLEVEGAAIEREFVEKYRGRLAGIMINVAGLRFEATVGCPFCQTCITSCRDCVTSCTHCITLKISVSAR